MILFLQDGDQIPNDAVVSLRIRSDFAPVPLTLEADILVLESVASSLKQGQQLTTAWGDNLTIVKAERKNLPIAHSAMKQDVIRVTAFLTQCMAMADVRSSAIVLENTQLQAIFAACGATIPKLPNDIVVSRFTCLRGQLPSRELRRVLGEEAGEVRWKKGRLEFIRFDELFKQSTMFPVAASAANRPDSELVERLEVPETVSTNDHGAVIAGSASGGARRVEFSPRKTELQLRNLTRRLIRRVEMRIDINVGLCAGDLVAVAGDQPMAVLTAVHCAEVSAKGSANTNAYTKLYLGTMGTA